MSAPDPSASSVVLEHFAHRTQKSSEVQRRRVYILPNMDGLHFALALFLMLVGAINYNSNLGFFIVFSLAGAGLWNIILTWRNLCGTGIECHPPSSVFAGQPMRFPLTVKNHTAHPNRSLTFSPAEPETEHPWTRSCSVHSGQQTRVDIPCETHQRGMRVIDPIRISTVYPLGWFRAWSVLRFPAQGLVYPRPAGNPTLPEPSLLEGQQTAGRQDGVDDFVNLRRYRDGDPIKTIFWKSLAWEQEPMAKQFVGRGSRKLLLSWQHVRHLPDMEARISQLCLWVLEASREGREYRLDIPGTDTGYASGEAHQHHCLTALALFGAD